MNDDLISRQAVIEAIENINLTPSVSWLDYASDIIKALPPAEPERKKGKWIRKEIHSNWSDWTEYTCSLCGTTFKGLYKANFCPNCGAEMGEDNAKVGGL